MPKTNLPTDSAMRKEMPIATGVLDYFPDALGAVARLSVLGNEKHNPGEPLHWARGKSMDQPDCIMRHTAERNTIDTDDGVLHDIKLAWRALANAQTVIEDRIARGLPIFDEEIIAANRAKQKAAREAKTKTSVMRGDLSASKSWRRLRPDVSAARCRTRRSRKRWLASPIFGSLLSRRGLISAGSATRYTSVVSRMRPALETPTSRGASTEISYGSS
jgi:hypothetical protein